MLTRAPHLRLVGHGEEAIRGALAAGASWSDIGRALKVSEDAQTEHDVVDAFAEQKREVWRRFWA